VPLMIVGWALGLLAMTPGSASGSCTSTEHH
jgi:hypothetical protein